MVRKEPTPSPYGLKKGGRLSTVYFNDPEQHNDKNFPVKKRKRPDPVAFNVDASLH
jgi:hypothetical protein